MGFGARAGLCQDDHLGSATAALESSSIALQPIQKPCEDAALAHPPAEPLVPKIMKASPTMKISRLQYAEYVGEQQEWVLNGIEFSPVNLVVGKNSTGKSRVLSVLAGLGRLIDGQQKIIYDSGHYQVEFESNNGKFEYSLRIDRGIVSSESLFQDGRELFSRNQLGEGSILNERAGGFLEFSIPPNLLVLSAKRDRLQHSFIELFHTWAASIRFYPFGTSLGREQLAHMPDLLALVDNDAASIDQNRLIDVYTRGYGTWGDDYDQAILRDLERLGYPCTDVGVDMLDLKGTKGLQLAALFVQESDLTSTTFQTVMSQGMFRALGMVIHLNYACFFGEYRTVIIDDIGEGLDFERACRFVDLLIERCLGHGFQLFMSTNDRFVMNEVNLDHWCVLSRESSVVTATTKRSNPELFEEMEFLGLNNFDLFSNGILSGREGSH